MAKYQYVGREYTHTELEKDGERVKVREGEIIESDLPETYFTLNGFQKLEVKVVAKDDGKDAITLKVEAPKTEEVKKDEKPALKSKTK